MKKGLMPSILAMRILNWIENDGEYDRSQIVGALEDGELLKRIQEALNIEDDEEYEAAIEELYHEIFSKE